MQIQLRKRITTQELSDGIFFVTYTCFLTYSLLGHIEGYNHLLKPITILSLIILFGIFIMRLKEYSAKSGMLAGVFLMMSVFSALITSDFGLVKLVLFISLSKGIRIDKCVRVDLVLRIILILYVLYLYYMGYAPDYIAYSGMTVRHSMGFTNPNAFGMAILIVCLEILYLAQMKFNIFAVSIVCSLIIYSDLVAHCRSVTLVLIIAIVLCILNSPENSIFSKTIVIQICSFVPVVFFLLTFIFCRLFMMRNQLAIAIDSLLTKRLYLISRYFERYHWNIVGHKIGTMDFPLDNMYAYLFFGLGIIITVIFLAIFCISINRLFRYNMCALAIILIIFAFYGLSERLWINIDYNIFMITFGVLLFPNEFKQNNKSQVNKNGSFS